MREKIIALRQQGKTYRQITTELKCSQSLVAYYLNSTTKKRTIDRQRENRFSFKQELRKLHGNKCIACGYSKCPAVLHFHHVDPSQKKFEITSAIHGKIKTDWEEIVKEAKKCVLLCSNCHTEHHMGFLNLEEILRRLDLNQRSSPYEDDELPDFSTPRYKI